jgi:hypothetical protein
MKNTTPLSVEQLEARCTPTLGNVWGIPWPSPQLTLSFAPDGTPFASQQSQLFATLGADTGQPPAVWEREILRAFQTWAVNAGVNIGLVADGGQPFGAPGAIQGDSRFGDVRIGAAALSPTEVASSQPYNPAAGTLSGDVLLNTQYPFGLHPANAYDLYTVAPHEAGHVFGFPDETTDPTSVMYQNYFGPRTGLSAGDVSQLRSLYGPPPADPYAVPAGSDPFTAAMPIQVFRGQGNLSQQLITGDLSAAGSVDAFKVQLQHTGGPYTVQLRTAGISLFEGPVTVYDSSHNVVGSAVATDPTNGNLTVAIGTPGADGTYYVTVQGASADVFGQGGYQLQVNTTDPYAVSAGQTPFSAATRIQASSGPISGDLNTVGAVDAFAVPLQRGTPYSVQLQTSGISTLRARLTVYDPAHNVVGSVSATDPADGDLTIQIPAASKVGTYYVTVQGAAANTSGLGAYQLQVVPIQGGGTNSRPAQPFKLGSGNAISTGAYSLSAQGLLQSANEVDYYVFQSPAATAATPMVLTVTVSALPGSNVDALAVVCDQQLDLVPGTVLSHQNDTYVLQVASLQPSRRYFVAVSASGQTNALGGYSLGLNFGGGTTLATLATGTVAAAPAPSGSTTNTPASFGFTVSLAQAYHFVLSADSGGVATAEGVQMTIYDQAGDVVAMLTAAAGQTNSLTIYLPAGTYTVLFSILGSAGVPLTFTLQAAGLSAPIEPYPIDPTLQTAAPTGTTSTSTPTTSPTTTTLTTTTTSPSPATTTTKTSNTTGLTSLGLLSQPLSISLWF